MYMIVAKSAGNTVQPVVQVFCIFALLPSYPKDLACQFGTKYFK